MLTQSLAFRELSGRANLWISRRRLYLYGHYPLCRCEYYTVGIIGIWEMIQTRVVKLSYVMLKLKPNADTSTYCIMEKLLQPLISLFSYASLSDTSGLFGVLSLLNYIAIILQNNQMDGIATVTIVFEFLYRVSNKNLYRFTFIALSKAKYIK